MPAAVDIELKAQLGAAPKQGSDVSASKNNTEDAIRAQGFTILGDKTVPLSYVIIGAVVSMILIAVVIMVATAGGSPAVEETSTSSTMGKVAVAKFDSGGVSGTITLSQATATAPTIIVVDLSGLTAAFGPFGWHVHELPVTAAGCGATGGHFGTASNREIGELTKRHNALPAATSVQATFSDKSLGTLYGNGSVVGRSIVLHKKNGQRWVCATLAEPNFAPRTATAQFKGPMRGIMSFTQGAPGGPTVITTALTNVSYGPNPWHIHEGSVRDNNCATASGHYNPIPNYGEMSSKFGDIPTRSSGNFSNTSHDSQVQLFGANTIIGRSIVLHKSVSLGKAKWMCAPIVGK